MQRQETLDVIKHRSNIHHYSIETLDDDTVVLTPNEIYFTGVSILFASIINWKPNLRLICDSYVEHKKDGYVIIILKSVNLESFIKLKVFKNFNTNEKSLTNETNKVISVYE